MAVTSKDKVLEVVGIGDTKESKTEKIKETAETVDVEEVASEESGNKKSVPISSKINLEEMLGGEPEETKVADPPKHVQLNETEYSTLAKTLSTLTQLKQMDHSEEAAAQINLLEMSIWDDLVKKFGFTSVESAQSAGFTFGLRRIFVVECNKK